MDDLHGKIINVIILKSGVIEILDFFIIHRYNEVQRQQE